jgi:hypothetical protein
MKMNYKLREMFNYGIIDSTKGSYLYRLESGRTYSDWMLTLGIKFL